MPIDTARTDRLLKRMPAVLRQVRKDPTPNAVHQIRTTARRLEALLREVCPDDEPAQRLAKPLRKLRKRAGRVRDVDVQLATLRHLHLGRNLLHRRRLQDRLEELRARHAGKLVASLDAKALAKLGRRITAAAPALRRSNVIFDPVRLALDRFAALARASGGINRDTLHDFRTGAKRIRYIAEMAGTGAEAEQVVQALKRIQDAAGQWHDLSLLVEAAERALRHPQGSALVAALRNLDNAQFAQARKICLDARRELLTLAAQPKAPPKSAPAAMAGQAVVA